MRAKEQAAEPGHDATYADPRGRGHSRAAVAASTLIRMSSFPLKTSPSSWQRPRTKEKLPIVSRSIGLSSSCFHAARNDQYPPPRSSVGRKDILLETRGFAVRYKSRQSGTRESQGGVGGNLGSDTGTSLGISERSLYSRGI